MWIWRRGSGLNPWINYIMDSANFFRDFFFFYIRLFHVCFGVVTNLQSFDFFLRNSWTFFFLHWRLSPLFTNIIRVRFPAWLVTRTSESRIWLKHVHTEEWHNRLKHATVSITASIIYRFFGKHPKSDIRAPFVSKTTLLSTKLMMHVTYIYESQIVCWVRIKCTEFLHATEDGVHVCVRERELQVLCGNTGVGMSWKYI